MVNKKYCKQFYNINNKLYIYIYIYITDYFTNPYSLYDIWYHAEFFSCAFLEILFLKEMKYFSLLQRHLTDRVHFVLFRRSTRLLPLKTVFLKHFLVFCQDQFSLKTQVIKYISPCTITEQGISILKLYLIIPTFSHYFYSLT